MSENCYHSNPLRRDGTSQQQRTLSTLLPSYVAVDERSMKDLMAFVHSFGEEIQFFDATNATDGHWADFFKLTDDDWSEFSLEDFLTKLKIDQQTNPHLALFFGFLYMFKVVQDDINTITERHLNFYYKDVLQLKEKPAQTDKVAIIFELAKHIDSHLMKAGTALKAGKDNTGVEATYKLNTDTVINKAQVASIQSQFTYFKNEGSSKPKHPNTNHRIYTSPVANSADGLGADIETDEKDWRVFGKPDFITNEDDPTGFKIADRQESQVGFAIASPILFLAEGQRKIELDMLIDFDGNKTITYTIKNEIEVYLSGEEEWIKAVFLTGDNAFIKYIEEEWRIQITMHLKVDQPSIVAYSNEVFEENIATNWPVLKLIVNTTNASSRSFYQKLINTTIDNIKLSVEIDGESTGIPGIQNFIAQNDQSILDVKKPMPIFGPQPHLGSKFYIGSKEIFQKKLDFINLKFQWVDMPDDSIGFKSYYKYYNTSGTATSTSQERHNHDYFTKIEVLRKKEWKTVTNSTALLTNSSSTALWDVQLPQAGTKSKLSVSNTNLNSIKRNPEIEDFEEYNTSLDKGFIRFSLKGVDFGHKDFQNAYAFHAINLAKSGGSWQLPNPPYNPSIEELSIYYKSSVSFNLNSSTDATEDGKIVEQFFHLEPFGNYEVDKTKTSNSLLPVIENEGNLFIAIENLEPPQTLSLLIQVAEGSANPDKAKQDVNWSFLVNDKWEAFDQYSLLSDSTNSLLTSGIITFDIPRNITNTNSRLLPNWYWLKASVKSDSDAICDIIDIQTQAISASFSDNENDPKFLENALPAESISKLVNADAAIKKLTQPYASYDGKAQEKEKAFFTRVSERLRHKNRSITIWDYEHLILEEFSKVYKVKCVNHTRFDGTITNYNETAPGHVSLVIIANVQNKNAVDPLRPKASLAQLDDIESFIKKIMPPCVNLHVKNPIYEEVKVKFNVKFHKGIDAGYYLAKLQEEIKKFLSPWSSECATDIVFGGRIHKSMIINFVEERSYVDYVTCFKMDHIIKDGQINKINKDVEEAIALTSVSIIGSANEHTIHEIKPSQADQCDCEDNLIAIIEK